MEITDEMIKERAFKLWCKRGYESNELQNWMDAKQELEHEQLMEFRIDDEEKKNVKNSRRT